MSYLDAFLLAIIQGITEFLPISSSAHLIILSYILEISSNLFYDVSLHLGTLIAVCAYFKNEIKVSYRGTIPNLFGEGKGVVAEGKLQDKKFFLADRILAKHDENYMPPELKNIMKENVK